MIRHQKRATVSPVLAPDGHTRVQAGRSTGARLGSRIHDGDAFRRPHLSPSIQMGVATGLLSMKPIVGCSIYPPPLSEGGAEWIGA